MKQRLSLLVLVILLASCGRITGSGEPRAAIPSPPRPADFDRGQDNWRNPIFGDPVDTPAAAQATVPFEVWVPKDIGSSPRLFVSTDDIPPAGRSVAFVFDTSAFGTVDVVEHVPEIDAANYEESHRSLLAYNGDPLTHGSFEIVTAPNGTEALLTIGEGGTPCVMFWLQGDAEIVLKGPVLTRNGILQVASQL